MNNKEVAHLWANQSRERAKGSSFYFEGDTIYSYGSHFPIARHFKGCVLFTSKGYSNTTARHKSITFSACHHLPVFTVSSPIDDPSGKDVREYGESIKHLATKAARARNPDTALGMLQREVDEANRFCERFGFKTRFTMPENLEELKAKAAESAARERKQKALAKARFEQQCAETVQKWIAGESVQIPAGLDKVYLRVNACYRAGEKSELPSDAVMQTSRGATVPLAEAEKAFRFAIARRNHGWHRNGDQFKVGDYQLDAVNEFGVIAGCHRISWDEIERFAKAQNWI